MLNRRSFILGGLALYEASARPLIAAGAALQNQKFPVSPFTLGVASGDPSPDGVVLWTRLAIDPLNGGGMTPHSIQVDWEVATDDRMMGVVRKGRTSASPASAHSVHVEVSGLEPRSLVLVSVPRRQCGEPDRPHADVPAARSAVERLRFAIRVVPALRAGALHRVRAHGEGGARSRPAPRRLHLRETRASTTACASTSERELISARRLPRTATRSTGPIRLLQAAHAAFPWLVVWDDHEVDNNYAGPHLRGRATR